MTYEQAPTYAPAEGVSVMQPNDQGGSDLQVMPTLAECEVVIEQYKRSWFEAGRALAVIRDGRLYRVTHSTFEAYCRERWGFSRPRAYQLIAAAEMSTTVDIKNERQARALRVIQPEEEAIEEPTDDLWNALVSVMDAIESLTNSDAPSIAATVPSRRRATTARRLRKLGVYLGGIAWTLEGSEAQA